MKRLPFAPGRIGPPFTMSIWTSEDIIDISFLPAYVLLLFVIMYNLWAFHLRREYVLLLICSGRMNTPLSK